MRRRRKEKDTYETTREWELRVKEEQEKNDRLKRQLAAIQKGLEHELELIRIVKRNHTR